MTPRRRKSLQRRRARQREARKEKQRAANHDRVVQLIGETDNGATIKTMGIRGKVIERKGNVITKFSIDSVSILPGDL